MSKPTILFTHDGREEMRKYLPSGYMASSSGYLDIIGDRPVTDVEAIEILLERKDREIAEKETMISGAAAFMQEGSKRLQKVLGKIDNGIPLSAEEIRSMHDLHDNLKLHFNAEKQQQLAVH